MFAKEVYYYHGLIANFIAGLHGILYLSFIPNICLNHIFCLPWKTFVWEREKTTVCVVLIYGADIVISCSACELLSVYDELNEVPITCY